MYHRVEGCCHFVLLRMVIVNLLNLTINPGTFFNLQFVAHTSILPSHVEMDIEHNHIGTWVISSLLHSEMSSPSP